MAVALPLGIAAKSLIQAEAIATPHANGTTDTSASASTSDASTSNALAQLVAPVAVGTQLGPVSVAAIGVDRRGLGVVTLVDQHGQQWHAELARRSPEDADLNPIALSNRYSLYLRNGGGGSTPTDQHVGRAALVIARNVQKNEAAAPALTLPSRAEFWAATGYRPGTARS